MFTNTNHPSFLEGFTEVTEQEFEDHLKTCPDYTRDNVGGVTFYLYRGYSGSFAKVNEGKYYIKSSCE